MEKYPRSLLGRNKKRFLEREREAALARGVLDIRRPMPMGARVPRVVKSGGAEICVYTNESAESRFHREGWNDRS